MSDAYQHLDDDALQELLRQHSRNLRQLELREARLGLQTPPYILTEMEDERDRLALLRAEQERRGLPGTSQGIPAPGTPAPLPPAPGSPFVVGRPLRAGEPIFGRAAAFRFIAGELARFSSLNIVGERRMGKTSLLNHLLGHQERYLTAQPDRPPLLLARLDLQDSVSGEERFYGTALRELLANLPPDLIAAANDLASLRERLAARPEAGYDTFRQALRRLRERDGICICPVLAIDEFERLLDPAAHIPYPDFFNGLRALLTADLLALVVASRRPLAEYFSDPARPGTLTSTFPNYLTPLPLPLLTDADADALLLQPSDHLLTLVEAAEARGWARGHPCHLQVAGAACYQARVEGQSQAWIHARREEVRRQSCMVDTTTMLPPEPRGWLRRLLDLLKRT